MSKLLKDVYPHLVAQIHPTKNEGLNVNQLTIDSIQNIWWLCECGNEWKQIVTTRGIDVLCSKCREAKRKPQKKEVLQHEAIEFVEKQWMLILGIPEHKKDNFKKFIQLYSHQELCKGLIPFMADSPKFPYLRSISNKLLVSYSFITYWVGKLK